MDGFDMRPGVRIGVLIPEGNITCEAEFPALCPRVASFHFQRLPRQGTELSSRSLLSLHEGLADAADRLRLAGPSAVVFACTSGTFLAGHDAHDDAGAALRRLLGRPAITTASALLQACRALAVRQVHMLAPYPEDITAQEADFLRHHGVDASGFDAMGCADGDAIRAIGPGDVHARLSRHAGRARASGAVFISCTNVPTLGLISALEAEFGVPVFSSNTATAWAALRLAGLDGPLHGLGRLGEMALPEPSVFR